MVKFALTLQKFDKVNASAMVYSNYLCDEDFYKGKNIEDVEFYISNYPIDAKKVTKSLGEDKLIKNANRDSYNEASGHNISLLRYKSMLRRTAKDFMKEKIIPYFN